MHHAVIHSELFRRILERLISKTAAAKETQETKVGLYTTTLPQIASWCNYGALSANRPTSFCVEMDGGRKKMNLLKMPRIICCTVEIF